MSGKVYWGRDFDVKSLIRCVNIVNDRGIGDLLAVETHYATYLMLISLEKAISTETKQWKHH